MGGCMGKYEPSDNDKARFAAVVKSQCESFSNIQSKIIDYYLDKPDRLDAIIDSTIIDTGGLCKKDMYVYLYSLKKDGKKYVSDKDRIRIANCYEVSEIKPAITLKGDLSEKKSKTETQPINIGGGMGGGYGTGYGTGPSYGTHGITSVPTGRGAIPYYNSPPRGPYGNQPMMGGSLPPPTGSGPYPPPTGSGYPPQPNSGYPPQPSGPPMY